MLVVLVDLYVPEWYFPFFSPTCSSKSMLIPRYSLENCSVEQNRMVQLEGTYNNHLVQLPDHFRADLKSKHVVKGIIQIPLKH